MSMQTTEQFESESLNNTNNKPANSGSSKIKISYEIQELIGQGKTSNVYKCLQKEIEQDNENQENNIDENRVQKAYAMKKFKNCGINQNDIKNEIKALSMFDNQNLISLIAQQQQISEILDEKNILVEQDQKSSSEAKENNSQKNEKISYIILEYLPKGELFDYVYQSQKKFPRYLCKQYFTKIASAVSHMHSKNYCHRDIKLENCFLDSNFDVKLGDLGFACENVKGSKEMSRILGTDGYMAPEMCMHRAYDGFKVDVFALGVVLFIMCQGFPPYFKKALGSDPYYRYFTDRKLKQFWINLKKKLPQNIFEDDFTDLISKMLEPCADQRISIQEVLEHPFLSQQSIESDTQYTDEEKIQYMQNLQNQMQENNE